MNNAFFKEYLILNFPLNFLLNVLNFSKKKILPKIYYMGKFDFLFLVSESAANS